MKKNRSVYVIDMRNSLQSTSEFAIRESLDEAITRAHEFFLSRGFILRGGKPFDPASDTGDESGFECFDSFQLERGRVSSFSHCSPTGPSCYVSATRDVK